MKYILNVLWASIFTFFLLCGVKELAVSPTAIKYTYWVFRIPFWHQVFFWWVVFSFPSYAGQTVQLIGRGIFSAVTYGIQGAGQLLEYLLRNRAGRFVIGGLVAYLIFTYFLTI